MSPTSPAYKFTHRGYRLIEDEREIFNWANEMGMSLRVSDNVTDPRTFEPSQTWFFETEEDKTIFLLKWS